jgi:hypothetical protein
VIALTPTELYLLLLAAAASGGIVVGLVMDLWLADLREWKAKARRVVLDRAREAGL